VEQDQKTGAITYRVSTVKGQQVFNPADVLHVLGTTLDGIRGVSPITLARESIGGAIAELRHGQSFFKNGANPSGVLQHPGHLGPEAAETLRKSWRDKYTGSDNAGKVAVLEEGMTFQPVSLSNKDSQWLESRQVTVLDVARIFGVPPALLGHLEKASYSSQEAQNLEFLTHSLRPWLTRIEQACNRSLLGHSSLYCEFTTGDLLRTDLKSRFDAYRTALAAGFMSVNEVRKLENLPAVDGGDKLFRPLNMGELGKEEPANGEGN
jgi:HK97 family phage portal protein